MSRYHGSKQCQKLNLFIILAETSIIQKTQPDAMQKLKVVGVFFLIHFPGNV